MKALTVRKAHPYKQPGAFFGQGSGPPSIALALLCWELHAVVASHLPCGLNFCFLWDQSWSFFDTGASKPKDGQHVPVVCGLVTSRTEVTFKSALLLALGVDLQC